MRAVRIAGHEVVYDGVLITSGDGCGVDIEISYGGRIRRFMLLFCAGFEGTSGVWVHNSKQHNYTSLTFAGWGQDGDQETILNPPVRFCDLDGQQFQLTAAHRRIGEAHRAAVQIVAVPNNYAGAFTPALYGSDQPMELRIIDAGPA
jgi:hypothetical protein